MKVLPVELTECVLKYLVDSPSTLINVSKVLPEFRTIINLIAKKAARKQNIYGAEPLEFLRFEKENTCLFCPKRRYLKAFDGLRVCTDCMYGKMISATQAKQQYMIDCNDYNLSCYTYCNQYNVMCRKYFEYQVKLVALDKYGNAFDTLLEKRKTRREKTEMNRQLRREKIMYVLKDLPIGLVKEHREVSLYINTGRPCTDFAGFSYRIKKELQDRWSQERRLIELEKALHDNNVYMYPCHETFRDYVYKNHGTIPEVIEEAFEERWLFKYTEYKGGHDNAKRRAIRSWLKKLTVLLVEKPPKNILERLIMPILDQKPFVFTENYRDCSCGNESKFLVDYRYYDSCPKCVQHCSIIKNVYTCGLECPNNYLELDYRYRKEDYVEFVCYQDSLCYGCGYHLWVVVDVNGIEL